MKIISVVLVVLFGFSVNGDLIGQNRLGNNVIFHKLGRAKFDKEPRLVLLGIAAHFVQRGEIDMAIAILESVADPPNAAPKTRRQEIHEKAALRALRTRHANRRTKK